LVRGDVSRRCEASMFSASFRSIPLSCAVRLVLLFTASPSFAANRAFDATAAFTMPRFEALLLVSVTCFATQIVNFGFLHYPWAVECLAGYLALGLLSVAAAWGAGFAIGPADRLSQRIVFLNDLDLDNRCDRREFTLPSSQIAASTSVV
jgi:hypothetical protein